MRFWALVAVTAVVLVPVTLALAITPSQIDNFEDGTTQGWGTGSSGAPTNIPAGGPAGANDNYMQMNSTGTGSAGGRLIVFNGTQWTGDYIAAGVTAIEMDFKNSTNVSVPMRIALKSAFGNSPGYVTTNAISVPADAAWHHAVFSISAGSMTAVNTADSFATFVTSIGEVRLLASVSPSVLGDAFAGPVGVDNITAVAPEPSAALSLIVCSALGLRRRGR